MLGLSLGCWLITVFVHVRANECGYDDVETGTLSRECSTMSRMQQFSVAGNDNLSGSLPPEYSIMEMLQFFESIDTKVTSIIPNEWSVFDSSVEIEV